MFNVGTGLEFNRVPYVYFQRENNIRIRFRTKILIKSPRTVFAIENRFQAAKHALATTIQSVWRGYVARKRFRLLKTAVIHCQYLFRRKLRQKKLLKADEYENYTRTVVFVQKNIRRFLAVRAYRRKLQAALVIKK